MPDTAPPPKPPPHGSKSSPLPNGNYDVFIIPPHSAGSGFLYLPSLQPQRNSFLAGVACTLLAVGLYTLLMPALRQLLHSVAAGGGIAVVCLCTIVAVGAWAFGKTQGESAGGQGAGSSGGGNAGASGAESGPQKNDTGGQKPQGPTPGFTSSGPKPFGTGTGPSPSASASWEKAREETRKREEERKRAEEVKKKQEQTQKAKEEKEKAARAAAEKEKWEQARAREKDAREREAREKIARERLAREKAARATATPVEPGSPGKRYERPTARSCAGTEEEYSYRPYDTPKPRRNPLTSSQSSTSGLSESSYAASHSTARTTPPPSHRGPYTTKDPDKIVIKGVYLFNNMFPKPVSQLVTGEGSVTDGLILRITTEGLFIDDDVRGVPQREWDVKAWGMKLVETGRLDQTHVLRASLRDTEGKRYVFVLPEDQSWKVDMGLQKLRKGSQVRAMGMNGLKEAEIKGMLIGLGWM